jgi:hypothetical protein
VPTISRRAQSEYLRHSIPPQEPSDNRKGERIYHLPGQLDYAQIDMTKGLGERWFCTEAEADAAGWRADAPRRP